MISVFQANYLDWSDSDDEPASEQQERKAHKTKSRRAFSAISEASDCPVNIF